jgi:LPS export ABC transporter protein LptC
VIRNALAILILCAFGVWMWPRLEEMHRPIRPPDLRRRIKLEGVEVHSFDADGGLETKVTGDTALASKQMEELEITPCRVEMYEDGAWRSTLTAKVGKKLSRPGEPETFEFLGDVKGESSEGNRIFGEQIQYLVKLKDIVAPAPATVVTTTTRISGKTMRGNVDLQRGTFLGEVRLHHKPASSGGAGQLRNPLEARSQQMDFDLKVGHHRLEGEVGAVQGDMTLKSDTLDFFREEQKLLAVGAVEVVQGALELEGEQVEYRMDTERALARGAPRVVQNPLDGGRQVMRAREILASNKGGWVRGEGTVNLVTYVRQGGRLVKDAEIHGDKVEAFQESGRATFTGNVRIDSGKATARGRNAVYYRDSRRVYVNGDAEAVEKDARGAVLRRVRGEHILHYLDTGKSVVLGGVRGQVQEGR